VLLLAIGTSSASAIIVHLEDGTTLSYWRLRHSPPGAGVSRFDAFFKNLDYNGGPVMTSNTNYTLYWSPGGASAYPAGFITGVNTYLKDLEHTAGGIRMLTPFASQYNDAAGEFRRIQLKIRGRTARQHAYPANGCTRAPKCLTDKQIQEELVKVHRRRTPAHRPEPRVLRPDARKASRAALKRPEMRARPMSPVHHSRKYCAYTATSRSKAAARSSTRMTRS